MRGRQVFTINQNRVHVHQNMHSNRLSGKRFRKVLQLPMEIGPGVTVIFEMFNHSQRMTIMSGLSYLLNNYPDTFLEICNEAKIKRSAIVWDEEPFPYWLDFLLKEAIYLQEYFPSIEEIQSCKRYLESKGEVVRVGSISKQMGRKELFRKRKWLVNELGLLNCLEK